MLFLKIMLPIIGLLFISFGYLIYFKKKYSLINGFTEAYKRGEKTEAYAKRVGLVELILGVLFLIAAGLVIIFF